MVEDFAAQNHPRDLMAQDLMGQGLMDQGLELHPTFPSSFV
jgi:hypothetical protein